MNRSKVRQVVAAGALTALFVFGIADHASAQAYISPFLGYNFGGDSGCPEVSNCEDKRRNLGVAFGSIGSVFGTEAEFSYIDNFFGDTPGTSSSVLTFMGNVMFAPKFGVLQPYGVVGLGLIKTHAELTAAAFSSPTTIISGGTSAAVPLFTSAITSASAAICGTTTRSRISKSSTCPSSTARSSTSDG